MVGLVQPKLVSWILEKSALQYYRITFFIISINTYWLYVINIHLYSFPGPDLCRNMILYPYSFHCTPFSNKNHTWDNTASSRDQWQLGDPDVTESHSTVGNIVLEPQVFQETELDDGNFRKLTPEWEARKRKQFSVVEDLCLLNQKAKPKESSGSHSCSSDWPSHVFATCKVHNVQGSTWLSGAGSMERGDTLGMANLSYKVWTRLTKRVWNISWRFLRTF